jgi:hypothetical protein
MSQQSSKNIKLQFFLILQISIDSKNCIFWKMSTFFSKFRMNIVSSKYRKPIVE